MKDSQNHKPFWVDSTLCEGYRFCQNLAPHMIEVHADGPAKITSSFAVEEMKILEKAMRACPRRAIQKIVESVSDAKT